MPLPELGPTGPTGPEGAEEGWALGEGLCAGEGLGLGLGIGLGAGLGLGDGKGRLTLGPAEPPGLEGEGLIGGRLKLLPLGPT
ncbi:MAG: hypothetical protein RR553_09105, partial [Akkermansia sp.]